VVSEGNTANLRQKIPDVIAFASKYFTLEPGDLIHIGTAVGKLAPGTITLRDISYQNVDGERTIEFEGVGRLTNFVAHLPE
jgi:2-keto-4-pentenoate hydratase/2-oxohepta-3-ene-1,7-dioic acid hydratase in catechol pathway